MSHLQGFSPRESDVLKGIVRGLTNKEISRELGISEETVKDYARFVICRCGVKNRVQAAVWAVRRGVA